MSLPSIFVPFHMGCGGWVGVTVRGRDKHTEGGEEGEEGEGGQVGGAYSMTDALGLSAEWSPCWQRLTTVFKRSHDEWERLSLSISLFH